MTGSAPISFNAGTESRDLVSANTACWFALRRGTSARPIAPLAPAIRILIAPPFSSLRGDSKRGQVNAQLQARNASRLPSRAKTFSQFEINCRAASRSLVIDRGLGAVIGDDVGDQP